MEPESSSPYSQVPTTYPYPKPTPINPHYLANSLAAAASESALYRLLTFNDNIIGCGKYAIIMQDKKRTDTRLYPKYSGLTL
jgi:hypothetical protein